MKKILFKKLPLSSIRLNSHLFGVYCLEKFVAFTAAIKNIRIHVQNLEIPSEVLVAYTSLVWFLAQRRLKQKALVLQWRNLTYNTNNASSKLVASVEGPTASSKSTACSSQRFRQLCSTAKIKIIPEPYQMWPIEKLSSPDPRWHILMQMSVILSYVLPLKHLHLIGVPYISERHCYSPLYFLELALTKFPPKQRNELRCMYARMHKECAVRPQLIIVILAPAILTVFRQFLRDREGEYTTLPVAKKLLSALFNNCQEMQKMGSIIRVIDGTKSKALVAQAVTDTLHCYLEATGHPVPLPVPQDPSITMQDSLQETLDLLSKQRPEHFHTFELLLSDPSRPIPLGMFQPQICKRLLEARGANTHRTYTRSYRLSKHTTQTMHLYMYLYHDVIDNTPAHRPSYSRRSHPRPAHPEGRPSCTRRRHPRPAQPEGRSRGHKGRTAQPRQKQKRHSKAWAAEEPHGRN